MREIDKVAFICTFEGKILTAKSHGKDKFYIPGGKRENGESDKQTLIREVMEELSVKINPETISFVGTFLAPAHDKPEGTTVKMACYYAKYSGELKANHEIEEIKWLNFADFDLIGPVDKIIFEFLKEKGDLK